MKLNAGDKAPAINSTDQNGMMINLEDLRGSRVILYFYPKDDTPGCAAEACNLRDNYYDLLDKGFKIIGVSADDLDSHQSFARKYHLPFPLIPDTDKKIIKTFGVWGKKRFMGREYEGINRTTFVISPDGLIEKIFTKVNTKDHTDQILAEFK